MSTNIFYAATDGGVNINNLKRGIATNVPPCTAFCLGLCKFILTIYSGKHQVSFFNNLAK
jgi:hypothetical protein